MEIFSPGVLPKKKLMPYNVDQKHDTGFRFDYIQILFSKKLPDNVDKNGKNYTQNNHGYPREINFRIFSFDTDISRKTPYPFEGIMEEKYNQSDKDNYQSGDNYIFSGLLIHFSKLTCFTQTTFK